MVNAGNILKIEMKPIFKDRSDAGRRLVGKLVKHQDNAVVIAIPRGGIPVAVEVAEGLSAPLDIIIPRKIPIPDNPEAGYGAVTENGSPVLNEPLVRQLGLTENHIKQQIKEVRAEIRRRSAIFREVLSPVDAAGKTAILIDDGLASGFTMIAAIKSLKKRKPDRIISAVPIASKVAYDRVKPLVDELVCLAVAYTPTFAVASFYQHWYDLTDEEVLQFLKGWQKKYRQPAAPVLISAS